MELCRLSLWWFGVISLIFVSMALELNANTMATQSEETEKQLQESTSTEYYSTSTKWESSGAEELNEGSTTEEPVTDYSTSPRASLNETLVEFPTREGLSVAAIVALVVFVAVIASFAGYLRYKYNHRTSYNL